MIDALGVEGGRIAVEVPLRGRRLKLNGQAAMNLLVFHQIPDLIDVGSKISLARDGVVRNLNLEGKVRYSETRMEVMANE